MERHGQVLKVKEEKLKEYQKLHERVWPEVLDMIKKCNIENYSIFYRDGYLFSYYEYVGQNYEEDMNKMKEDPKTQEWWSYTEPCQEPIESAKGKEWWAEMEEMFYLK